MKTILVALIIIFVSSSNAQVKNISERQYFRQFDWEVSTSIALGLSKTSIESTSQYMVNGGRDEEFYSDISLTLGYFLLDGLSLEPELDYHFFPNDASFSLIANLSYTLYIPQKSIYPFFKVGYGKSAYSGSDYGYFEGESEHLLGSLNSKIINAAIGIKIIQSSSFAMKLELNYKYLTSHKNVNEYYVEPYEFDTTTSVLSIKFGGSFLL
jgi:hypothetical protein